METVLGVITFVTTVTLTVLGWLIYRIEHTKKDLLKIRTNDLHHIDLKMIDLKKDIHDIYLYLLNQKD